MVPGRKFPKSLDVALLLLVIETLYEPPDGAVCVQPLCSTSRPTYTPLASPHNGKSHAVSCFRLGPPLSLSPFLCLAQYIVLHAFPTRRSSDLPLSLES